MNNDTAFGIAQRHYDNLTPEPPPDNPWEDVFPEETNGRFLRLKRKQLRVSLASMARELDLLPGYLHSLELGETPWPDGLELRYDRALLNLCTLQSL